MTKTQYADSLRLLYEKYEFDKKALAKEYALANNTVNKGDIVVDHIGKLLVNKIEVYLSVDNPQCVYTGTELKKDGTPKKVQDPCRKVFQSNIIRQQT